METFFKRFVHRANVGNRQPSAIHAFLVSVLLFAGSVQAGTCIGDGGTSVCSNQR